MAVGVPALCLWANSKVKRKVSTNIRQSARPFQWVHLTEKDLLSEPPPSLPVLAYVCCPSMDS